MRPDEKTIRDLDEALELLREYHFRYDKGRREDYFIYEKGKLALDKLR